MRVGYGTAGGGALAEAVRVRVRRNRCGNFGEDHHQSDRRCGTRQCRDAPRQLARIAYTRGVRFELVRECGRLSPMFLPPEFQLWLFAVQFPVCPLVTLAVPEVM